MTVQSDLKTMTSAMPESVDNLEKALSQIDGADKDIDTQIGAVTYVCTSAADELLNYLNLEKVPYLSENVNITANLVVGPNYGVTGYGNTLSDWSVHAMVEQPQPPPTVPPDPPAEYVPPADEVIYSTTVNWDGDSYITTWMNDWAAANDYLHRPLTSGATYGLVPYKQNLANTSNILNENKSKLETVQPIFEKYAGP
jgi:hypothetical protein